MSKIGNVPIQITSGVQIKLDRDTITIVGKEGQMNFSLPKSLDIKQEADKILIKNKNAEVSSGKVGKKSKSLHGLFRQLIFNAVKGVVIPWTKKLEVVGTGFNVKAQGEDIVFKIGYSHPVVFKKTPDIKFQVEGNNKVTVFGIDKQKVGQVAYQIKMLRKPDVYKGKGIRYAGEIIKLKPGKKVKAAGAAASIQTMKKVNTNRISRRKIRVSSQIFGTKEIPRVSVFASNTYTYAQMINDQDRKTLTAYSSLQLAKTEKYKKDKKVNEAKKVGMELANQAKKLGVKAAVLDRGRYSYKGRVKALADGLREGGIKI